MDGMILPRTQLEQGVTEPPFHPNCRCTTVPYDEDWDYKGQRIAKDKDGKYYYVPETMSYEEWKREFAQGGKSSNTVSGAVNGALNSDSKEAWVHAERYYESVRKMKTDVNRISDNTGFKISNIEKVKNHLFLEKYTLDSGANEYFYPDYDIAQSWQRLIDGKNIQNHDIVLLKHEYLEQAYMRKGLKQSEAHLRANRRFNYQNELSKYKKEA